MQPKVMPFRTKIIYGSAEKSYGSAQKFDNKSFDGSNQQQNQNLTSFQKFHSTESSPNSSHLPLYRRSYTHTQITNGVKVTIHRSNGYSRNSSLSDASSSTSIEKILKEPKPTYSRNDHYEFRYQSPVNQQNVSHPLMRSNKYQPQGIYEEYNKMDHSLQNGIKKLQEMDKRLQNYQNIHGNYSKRMENQNKGKDLGHLSEANNQLRQTVNALNKKKDEYLQDNLLKQNKLKLNDQIIGERTNRIKYLEGQVKAIQTENCGLKQQVESLKQEKSQLQLTIEENKVFSYSLKKEIECLKAESLKASVEDKRIISEYKNRLWASQQKEREMEDRIQYKESIIQELKLIEGQLNEKRQKQMSAFTVQLQKANESLKSSQCLIQRISFQCSEATQKYDNQQSSIQELIVSIEKQLQELQQQNQLKLLTDLKNKSKGEDLVDELSSYLKVYMSKIKQVCQINCQQNQKLKEEKEALKKKQLLNKQNQIHFETNSQQCQTRILNLSLSPQVLSQKITFDNQTQSKSMVLEMAVNTDESPQSTCNVEQKEELQILKQELCQKQNILEVMQSCIDDYKAMVRQMKQKLQHQDFLKSCYEEVLNLFDIQQKASLKVHDELMQLISVMISKLSEVESLEQQICKLSNENVNLKDRKKSYMRQARKFDEAVDKVSVENKQLRIKVFELATKEEQRTIYIRQLTKTIHDTNEETIRNYIKLLNHKVQLEIEYDNEDNKSSFSFDQPCFSMTKPSSQIKSSTTSQVPLFLSVQPQIKANLYDHPIQQSHNELESTIFLEGEVSASNEQASCLTPPTISLDQEDFLSRLEETVLRSPQLIDYKQDSQSEEVAHIKCGALDSNDEEK